jgi:hypothetical protein
MSLITITLAVASFIVIGFQAFVAVAYRLHFGRWLGVHSSARAAFQADVPALGFVIAGVVVICGLTFVSAPVLAPDSALSAWLREPYTTIVYVASCYARIQVLGWIVGLSVYLVKRSRRNGD